MKPCVLRPKAREDRRYEVRYHRNKAGEGTATRQVSALEAALLQLSRERGIGSPAIGQTLDVDGLRSWRLNGFPLSLWYFERASHAMWFAWSANAWRRIDIEIILEQPNDS